MTKPFKCIKKLYKTNPSRSMISMDSETQAINNMAMRDSFMNGMSRTEKKEILKDLLMTHCLFATQ